MSGYQECSVCVMDSTATEFEKFEDGCTFCQLARKMEPRYTPDERDDMVASLKGEGEYDVLLGLSGGVDSAMCLYILKVELGLRVLTYSVDNGYNNPLADENIFKLVEGMKVPFFRYVLDWKQFTKLQGAFLAAGLKNVEIPTDHMLFATSYEIAAKYGIKTIISGGNWATESIMPPSWGYNARDLTHIKDVYRKMIGSELTGLPTCSLLKFNYYRWWKGIEVKNLLDYFAYNRAHAVILLKRLYDFEDYYEKHCENYFTWWFQNYYLFEKWNIDKRKAHLSSLIVSKQMTRRQAAKILMERPVYPELGLERKAMRYLKREHNEFKQDEWLFNFIGKLLKYVRIV